MSRPFLLIALSLALAPGLLFAQETTVYKSKNADGTSVYTQIETRGAERTQLDGRDPKLPPAEAKPTPKTETEQACERAQANVGLLGSGKVLQRDKDGDGKPEPLTPEEITSEKDLAERQAAAYCPKPEA